MILLRTLRIAASWLAAAMACFIPFNATRAALTDDGKPLSAGTHKMLVGHRVSGVRRSYYVHIPSGDDGTAQLPVVVALHGAFSNALEFERESGFSLLADRSRFIVIYPQGIGFGNLFRHWNSGHCCGKARQKNIDDVGFVLAVVDDVASRNLLDRRRLYLMGFSNGGMLAYRIAAEHPDVIAAAAAVSGTIGGIPAPEEPEWIIPRPKKPVPILALHGRDDSHIPYDGGRDRRSRGKSSAISVSRSVQFWVDADGCDPESDVEPFDSSRVERQTWLGCSRRAEVVLYSINGWEHEWPNKRSLDGFDASATIWSFFERHQISP